MSRYTEQCIAELSQNPVIKEKVRTQDEDFRNVSYVTICLEPYAIQYDKLQEKFESASFLNKKMDAISERIKESGDQQCMKKLLDIYAKYPVIQR